METYIKKLDLLDGLALDVLEYYKYFASIIEFYNNELHAAAVVQNIREEVKKYSKLEINENEPLKSLEVITELSIFFSVSLDTLKNIFEESNKPNYYSLVAVNMSYTFMEGVGLLKNKILAKFLEYNSLQNRELVHKLLSSIKPDEHDALIQILLQHKNVTDISMQILMFLKKHMGEQKLLPYVRRMIQKIIPSKQIEMNGTIMALTLSDVPQLSMMMPREELLKKYKLEGENLIIIHNELGSPIAYDIKNTILNNNLPFSATSCINKNMIAKFSNVQKLAPAKTVTNKPEIIKKNDKPEYALLETYNSIEYRLLDKKATLKDDTIAVDKKIPVDNLINNFIMEYHAEMNKNIMDKMLDKDFTDIKDAFTSMKPVDKTNFKTKLASLMVFHILRLMTNNKVEVTMRNIKETLKEYYQKIQNIIIVFLIENSNFTKYNEYSLTNFVKIYGLIYELDRKINDSISEYHFSKRAIEDKNYLQSSLEDIMKDALEYLDDRKKLSAFIDMSLKDVYLSKKII